MTSARRYPAVPCGVASLAYAWCRVCGQRLAGPWRRAASCALCREAAARHGWDAPNSWSPRRPRPGWRRPAARPSTGRTWWSRSAVTGPCAAAPRALAGTGVPLGDRAARHRQPAGADARHARATRGRRSTSRSTGAGGDRPGDRPGHRRRRAVHRHGGDGPRRRRRRRDQAQAPVRLARLRDVGGGAPRPARRPGSRIRLDDGAADRAEARSVVVGNSGLLPGGFSLLPDARLDDGLLDVGVLAPHGPLGWPRVATRVLTHSHHQDRMLERFQARRVEITARATLPREVDGELISPGQLAHGHRRAERLDGADAAPLAAFRQAGSHRSLMQLPACLSGNTRGVPAAAR